MKQLTDLTLSSPLLSAHKVVLAVYLVLIYAVGARRIMPARSGTVVILSFYVLVLAVVMRGDLRLGVRRNKEYGKN
jgi:hypothetical protein